MATMRGKYVPEEGKSQVFWTVTDNKHTNELSCKYLDFLKPNN